MRPCSRGDAARGWRPADDWQLSIASAEGAHPGDRMAHLLARRCQRVTIWQPFDELHAKVRLESTDATRSPVVGNTATAMSSRAVCSAPPAALPARLLCLPPALRPLAA